MIEIPAREIFTIKSVSTESIRQIIIFTDSLVMFN